MTDVDLQLVREFFELNFFQVTTHWQQHDAQSARGDGGLQLYIENANATDDAPLETLLHPVDLQGLERAVVEVRAWHTDKFYASLLDSNPILNQFAEPWALAPARDFFGTDDFRTIIIVSELPRTPEQRAQAVERLQRTDIDHLMEFPALLQDLVKRVVLNGSYAGSPALQLLQLLKRYRLLRNQQMEFTFPHEPTIVSPRVEVDSDTGAE